MPRHIIVMLCVAACGSGSTGSTSDAGSDGSTDASPPGMVGWKLTASNTGLAGVGLTCASLPLYAGPSKPASGARIAEQRIETALDCSDGDIVIERSCIRPSTVGQGLPIVTTTDYNDCDAAGCAVAPAMVTIRDSEIDGSLLSAQAGAFATAFIGIGTLQRNYIHSMGSGIAIFNAGDQLDALVEGNYVRGLTAYGDPATTGNHSDGFTVRDFITSTNPARRLSVRNNRFDCCSGYVTGAFFVQTYGGDIDQVHVEGNLLEGNGYLLYLSAGFGNAYGANMHAVNNRFSNTGYGPAHVADPPGWATWQDNFFDDANATDHRGAPIDEP